MTFTLYCDNCGQQVCDSEAHSCGPTQKPIPSKIILSIRGGVVQDIFADAPVEVLTLDWDDIEEEVGKDDNARTNARITTPEVSPELVRRAWEKAVQQGIGRNDGII